MMTCTFITLSRLQSVIKVAVRSVYCLSERKLKLFEMSRSELIMELLEGDTTELKSFILNDPKILEEVDFKTMSHLLSRTLDLYFDYSKDVLQSIIVYGKNLSPLQHTLLLGDIQDTKSLLEIGEKPEGPSWYLESLVKCLFYRVNEKEKKRNKLLRLLMKYGFDTEFHNSKGENVLKMFMRFVEDDDLDAADVAEILINSGVLINEVDEHYESTPFLSSIITSNIPLISKMIEKAAIIIPDPEYIKNNILLTEAVDINVYKLLLSNGADINFKTSTGWTALHFSSGAFSAERIRFLIQEGADITAEDENGDTPFALSYLSDPEDEEDVHQRHLCMQTMIRFISRMLYEKISVNKKDVDLIEGDADARKYFQLCNKELEKISKTKFYSSYLYYFVLKSSKINNRRLAKLTKNQDFVKKFEAGLNSFSLYKDDLREIFDEAIQARIETSNVHDRLFKIFNNLFPDTVLRKLAGRLRLKDLPLDSYCLECQKKF